jgi:hypothetical protein
MIRRARQPFQEFFLRRLSLSSSFSTATTPPRPTAAVTKKNKKQLYRDWTLPSSLHSTTMGRNLDFFSFNKSGEYTRERMTLHDVLESYNLQARDLLSLERQNIASIQPRNSAVVLSLSHVRAVVSRDSVLVFNPDRPAVLDFVQGLSEYLALCAEMKRESETHSLPFELCVLEGILSSVSQKYQRRIHLFEPVINDVLRNMRQQGGPGHATEQIQTLLPLRNSLSRFERSNDNIVKSLERLLNSDEAMSLMSLTARHEVSCQGTDEAEAIDLNLHHDVELVVESYFRRFEDFYAESFSLRKNIEATQDTLELALDEYRNRLITINVHAAMATVGLAVSTSIAGFFGMNLYSGLEEITTYPLFWYVVGGATLGGGAIYATAVRQATKNVVGKQVTDLNNIVNLGRSTPGQHDEYDMQDILLSYLDGHGGENCSVTEKQFGLLMERATGKKIDNKEIKRIFAVFDHDNDGKLDYGDCIQFICTQNAVL